MTSSVTEKTNARPIAVVTHPDKLCPLDGAPTVLGYVDEFFVCTGCREILHPTETVAKAGLDTWAAYLSVGETDTAPEDAPLSRLGRHRIGD